MRPLISVIVPVYNVAEYLSECIESILKQTYSNLEIILIDDGSIDGSGQICDEYMKKDKRICVIHKNNGGVSSARNTGLEQFKGDYITFVDADDSIEPHYCEVLLDVIEKFNADMSCCSLSGIDGVKKFPIGYQSLNTKEQKIVNLKEDSFNFFQWYSINGPFCKLIKKDLIGELRFDESLCVGEDLVFYINLLKKSNKCVATAQTLYNYRIREGSAMHIKDVRHLYSEVQAWNITCKMLDNDWESYKRASEKLLFYTYRMVKSAIGQNYIFSVEEKKFIKSLFRYKSNYKYILGSGWKFKVLYPLLCVSPIIYFNINNRT